MFLYTHLVAVVEILGRGDPLHLAEVMVACTQCQIVELAEAYPSTGALSLQCKLGGHSDWYSVCLSGEPTLSRAIMSGEPTLSRAIIWLQHTNLTSVNSFKFCGESDDPVLTSLLSSCM